MADGPLYRRRASFTGNPGTGAPADSKQAARQRILLRRLFAVGLSLGDDVGLVLRGREAGIGLEGAEEVPAVRKAG